MIHRLASTENRERILEYILEIEEFGPEEVASALNLSKGLVSTYFRELIKLGIIHKRGRRFCLSKGPELKELKRFLNFWSLREALLPLKEDWMLALGVYGSFARGENGKTSDVDVWILVEDADPLTIMEFKEKLEKVLGGKLTCSFSQGIN
ncbi:nucleotidyltransferase domain-containing protein [Thermococcus waiotapuensis]|uniref:protein adenylyltransferase n=1 Tax=Thermococcus waiotapuensis TaxID=90909 RepID=A0AAE4NU56_9EURY|nr:nucleotidyltransferase domain-containing protein [Thermococcus waiotapuensis]MDV3103377.1 nucleotidyltransferase domain-containing protein [Thermococcus waiotapuensis]